MVLGEVGEWEREQEGKKSGARWEREQEFTPSKDNWFL